MDGPTKSSAGVRAYAVEDNSGASLYVFGTISQFHKPRVYVDKADLEEAGELLRQFEAKRDARRRDPDGGPSISAQCEECGAWSGFPASQDGTPPIHMQHLGRWRLRSMQDSSPRRMTWLIKLMRFI